MMIEDSLQKWIGYLGGLQDILAAAEAELKQRDKIIAQLSTQVGNQATTIKSMRVEMKDLIEYRYGTKYRERQPRGTAWHGDEETHLYWTEWNAQ